MEEQLEGQLCIRKVSRQTPFKDDTSSPVSSVPPAWYKEATSVTGNPYPAFRPKGGGQRSLPASAVSPSSVAQKNPDAKVACLEVAYSDSLHCTGAHFVLMLGVPQQGMVNSRSKIGHCLKTDVVVHIW